MTSVKNMLPRYIFGHHPHDSPPGLSRWHALRCCLSSSLVPSGAYGENPRNFRWRHWDQQKSPRSKKVWRNLNLQWNSWFGNSTFIYPEGWILVHPFFRQLFSHKKIRWKSTASTASTSTTPSSSNSWSMPRENNGMRKISRAIPKWGGCAIFRWTIHYPPGKTNMTGWKIHPLSRCISYRKLGFSNVMLVFWGCKLWEEKKMELPKFPLAVFFRRRKKHNNHLDTIFGSWNLAWKRPGVWCWDTFRKSKSKKMTKHLFYHKKRGSMKEKWKSHDFQKKQICDSYQSSKMR